MGADLHYFNQEEIKFRVILIIFGIIILLYM